MFNSTFKIQTHYNPIVQPVKLPNPSTPKVAKILPLIMRTAPSSTQTRGEAVQAYLLELLEALSQLNH